MNQINSVSNEDRMYSDQMRNVQEDTQCWWLGTVHEKLKMFDCMFGLEQSCEEVNIVDNVHNTTAAKSKVTCKIADYVKQWNNEHGTAHTAL